MQPEKRKRLEETLAVAQRAQANPAWWMERCCGWGLWDKQREISQALVDHDRVAVPAAFGVGKSHLVARLALWWITNFYPSKVITTAPTARQVKQILWSQIRKAHGDSNLKLGGHLLTQELHMGDEWYAVGFTTEEDSPDKFTGYHSPHLLLIFDQAAGIGREIWRAAKTLMIGDHCKWIAISNCTDPNSAMADICIPDRKSEFGDQWKKIKITAHDSPNVIQRREVIPGMVGYKWLQEQRRSLKPTDPLYRIMVEAEFVEESMMTILTGTEISSILEADYKPDYQDIEIGLDVADEGGDSSIWAVRAGTRLLYLDQVHGLDPMQVVAKTEEVVEKVQKITGSEVNNINVDRIGIGDGVQSRLGELGYPVTPVNVSRKAQDEDQFLNIRAELAWSIRKLTEQKKISLKPLISTPDQLINDMEEELTMRYKLVPASGKIQLEKKEKTRQRIRRSPDIWDAIMLAFGDAEPAAAISSLDSRPEPIKFEKKDNYTLEEWMAMAAGEKVAREQKDEEYREPVAVGVDADHPFLLGADEESDGW